MSKEIKLGPDSRFPKPKFQEDIMNQVVPKYKYWVKCISFYYNQTIHMARNFEFDHEFNSESINICTKEFKSELMADYNIKDPNDVSVVIEFFGRLCD